MKGVQCYELFGGIALKNHAFSFSYADALCISTTYIRKIDLLHLIFFLTQFTDIKINKNVLANMI